MVESRLFSYDKIYDQAYLNLCAEFYHLALVSFVPCGTMVGSFHQRTWSAAII